MAGLFDSVLPQQGGSGNEMQQVAQLLQLAVQDPDTFATLAARQGVRAPGASGAAAATVAPTPAPSPAPPIAAVNAGSVPQPGLSSPLVPTPAQAPAATPPADNRLTQASEVLGAVQPPQVDTSRFTAAPAIAPPAARGSAGGVSLEQLLALLQPQQAPSIPSLGQLIGGR